MPTNSPEPLTSIIWFVVVTIFYFVFKLNTNDSTTLQVYYSIYLLLVIIGEYFINLTLTKTICGSNQWNSTLIITLFPWIVIFGTINILLNVFPGWLVPFSNTIGYGIAKLSGLEDLLAKLFAKKSNGSLERVRDYPEPLISNLSYDDTKSVDKQDFWEEMKDIIVDPSTQGLDKMKESFIWFLRLKDIVSEFIWFIISGLLVTSISYNYLLNIGCKKTVQDMKNDSEAYNKVLNDSEQNKVKVPRLYSSNE